MATPAPPAAAAKSPPPTSAPAAYVMTGMRPSRPAPVVPTRIPEQSKLLDHKHSVSAKAAAMDVKMPPPPQATSAVPAEASDATVKTGGFVIEVQDEATVKSSPPPNPAPTVQSAAPATKKHMPPPPKPVADQPNEKKAPEPPEHVKESEPEPAQAAPAAADQPEEEDEEEEEEEEPPVKKTVVTRKKVAKKKKKLAKKKKRAVKKVDPEPEEEDAEDEASKKEEDEEEESQPKKEQEPDEDDEESRPTLVEVEDEEVEKPVAPTKKKPESPVVAEKKAAEAPAPAAADALSSRAKILEARRQQRLQAQEEAKKKVGATQAPTKELEQAGISGMVSCDPKSTVFGFPTVRSWNVDGLEAPKGPYYNEFVAKKEVWARFHVTCAYPWQMFLKAVGSDGKEHLEELDSCDEKSTPLTENSESYYIGKGLWALKPGTSLVFQPAELVHVSTPNKFALVTVMLPEFQFLKTFSHIHNVPTRSQPPVVAAAPVGEEKYPQAKRVAAQPLPPPPAQPAATPAPAPAPTPYSFARPRTVPPPAVSAAVQPLSAIHKAPTPAKSAVATPLPAPAQSPAVVKPTVKPVPVSAAPKLNGTHRTFPQPRSAKAALLQSQQPTRGRPRRIHDSDDDYEPADDDE